MASGPLAQTEGDARGFLHREIAGRKGVGMAEAEQKINIGGPRPDAVQRDQRCVRRVGIHVADRVEVDLAFGDRLADFLDRLDLGGGQAEPPELVGARARTAS